MWTPKPGDVVPYSYLWWREHETGEDSGRKLRPCVVVVAVKKQDGAALRVAVAAITHAPPGARAAIELPRAVKRHLRLDEQQSWVICDEINHFEWPGFDFGRTPSGARTYGSIPGNLLTNIRRLMQSVAIKLIGRD